MKWLLKKLGGAVVAGVGWKLGTDAYEFVKKQILGGGDDKASEAEEAAAEETAETAGDGDGTEPAPAGATARITTR